MAVSTERLSLRQSSNLFVSALGIDGGGGGGSDFLPQAVLSTSRDKPKSHIHCLFGSSSFFDLR